MKIKKYILVIFLLLTLNLNLSAFAKIETDTDQDGLTDYEEANFLKTSTTSKDTDGDSYFDGHEVYFGYSPTKTNQEPLKSVRLAVPYVSEAPDGNWTGPWKNACEEASMTMVEYYYLGNHDYSLQTSKDFMWNLFNKQNQIYGSNADADSIRSVYLINNFTSYWAVRKTNPTLDDIKKELQQKRPVITFHYGFDLKNSNIPFLPYGSAYHMMVLIGYDDDKKEFTTNDPGDTKAGANHRYDYDLFLKTLSDFNHSTGLAKGNTPTVIFTYPRLVKPVSGQKIYYLNITENAVHYVTSPTALSANNWNNDMIMAVQPEFLTQFTLSGDIAGPIQNKIQPAVISNSQSKKYTFTKYLSVGSNGEEVKQLQLKLKFLGYYSYSEITGYFGSITKEAVVKFQKAKNLSPYPGFVGSGTMAALNQW